MMPSVTIAQQSRRIVATLADTDPQFLELVTKLYGPQATPEQVWRETFGKMNPDSSSVHMPGNGSPGEPRGRKWALRVGLAGTVAGGAIAARDVGEGVRGLRRTGHIRIPEGKLIPAGAVSVMRRKPRLVAAAKTAFGATALGADAVAGGAVHRQQVNKGLGSATVEEMTKGILMQADRVTSTVLGSGAGGKALHAGDATLDTARVKRQLPGRTTTGNRVAPRSNTGKGPQKAPAAAPVAANPPVGELPPVPVNENAATQTGLGRGASALVGTPGRAAATGAAALVGAAAVKPKAPANQAGYFTQPAYYSKADVEWSGTFSKLDRDKQMAFGWANVCKLNGVLINDKQGDIIVPEDLEDAAYEYVLKSRVGGDMHLRTDGVDVYPQEAARPGDAPVPVGEIVESMMFTAEKKQALGLPDAFPEGWWIGMKYHDTKTWNEIKNGRRPGFSIHGSGHRVPIEDAA